MNLIINIKSRLTMRWIEKGHFQVGGFKASSLYVDCYCVYWIAESRIGKREKTDYSQWGKE